MQSNKRKQQKRSASGAKLRQASKRQVASTSSGGTTRSSRGVGFQTSIAKVDARSSPGRVSLSTSRLTPYQAALGKQFLTPINATQSLVLAPSSFPALVCARHYHKVYDISAVTFPDGFSAAMFPDLFAPGFVSSSAAVVIPPGGAGTVSFKGQMHFNGTGDVCDSSTLAFTDSQGHSAVTRLNSVVDSAALARPALETTAAAATTFTIDVRNVTKSTKIVPKFNVVYKTAAGAWTAIASYTLGEGANVAVSQTYPLNATAIGFYVTDGGGHPTSWEVCLSFGAAQFQIAAATALAPAFPNFLAENDLQYGRVLSMSMLITNTSPALTKGGAINAGRVPNSFDPFNDIVTQISALPSIRRHQGSAEDGAYVTWMPLQYDEFEIDNIPAKRQALSDAEYIFAQVNSWPAGSSVKIQCDWIVEFNTPSQNYEKVMTPPITDDFRLFYYHLLRMPAAMCNPSHDNLFKQLVAGGVQKFKDGAEFYERHKSTIHGLADILAMLAG